MVALSNQIKAGHRWTNLLLFVVETSQVLLSMHFHC